MKFLGPEESCREGQGARFWAEPWGFSLIRVGPAHLEPGAEGNTAGPGELPADQFTPQTRNRQQS